MLILQLQRDTDWLGEDLITLSPLTEIFSYLIVTLGGIALKLAILSNANTYISQIVLLFGFDY